LAEYDAIIIRSATKISAAVLKATTALRLVARAGVGVDNVDLKAASAVGVMVVNSPLSATNSVVELALAHLLSQARMIPRADRSLREGKWLKADLTGHELAGKNLGFIGFGRIGQVQTLSPPHPQHQPHTLNISPTPSTSAPHPQHQPHTLNNPKPQTIKLKTLNPTPQPPQTPHPTP
ncbi:hypothetical protein T484DRAFT_1619945, partial [Baffinella frigidus]